MSRMFKVHTKDGIEAYLNARYVVRFEDHLVVVYDYVYKPDLGMPEAKHEIAVFETSEEIKAQIEGRVSSDTLDAKYGEACKAAKEEHTKKFPF